MACTGGGYWDTDYLTGERYYAPGPGETCDFGCVQPMFKLYGADWSTQAECRIDGYLNRPFQFLAEGLDDLRCHPHYCTIPSFGLWPINENQQQGTSVTMGVECVGQVDHGTWVQVPAGAKCELRCTAENGVAYRSDTLVRDFW